MIEGNNGIYFTELTLQNVRCFGDEAVLKLSNDKGEWQKWNIILGDNGTGKTTLLQCLAGMEQDIFEEKYANEYGWTSKLFKNKKNISFRKISNRPSKKSTEITANIVNNVSKKNISLSFGQKSERNTISSSTGRSSRDVENLFILGYGANRNISFKILSENNTESENSETLFDDDAKLINTEEWLYQMEFAAAYAENKNSDLKDYAKKRRDLVFDFIKDLLPDDIKSITLTDDENSSPPIPVIKFETLYGSVGIKELSYGYKTMVAWVVDVAARMYKRYPNSNNPIKEPVIILVDEIDLHLHPKWQRQIFDSLEKWFPQAQFIVTAHSPLIVQSAPNNTNIIVLRKEKVEDEFIVKVDNDIESVKTWRVDQIMSSDLFGLDSSRNPKIGLLVHERTELLKKEKLTLSQRKRLEELNKIVHNLPTADKKDDIEAMDIIRRAAEYIKNQKK